MLSMFDSHNNQQSTVVAIQCLQGSSIVVGTVSVMLSAAGNKNLVYKSASHHPWGSNILLYKGSAV